MMLWYGNVEDECPYTDIDIDIGIDIDIDIGIDVDVDGQCWCWCWWCTFLLLLILLQSTGEMPIYTHMAIVIVWLWFVSSPVSNAVDYMYLYIAPYNMVKELTIREGQGVTRERGSASGRVGKAIPGHPIAEGVSSQTDQARAIHWGVTEQGSPRAPPAALSMGSIAKEVTASSGAKWKGWRMKKRSTTVCWRHTSCKIRPSTRNIKMATALKGGGLC
jgi:hypothetical protein